MLRPAPSHDRDPAVAALQPLLPARGQHVHLMLGEVRLHARVEDGLLGRLLLAVPAAPLDVRRNTDVAAQVHSSQEAGVCRLLGRLRAHSGFAVDGVLVEFSYAGTQQLLLRREHVRADLSTPIELDLPTGEVVRTRTINASAGGLLVKGPSGVRAGQLVNIFFRLPDGRAAVTASARVARITLEGNAGLELVQISPADQARLTLTVFEQRRRLTTPR